ncbi:hypothetical protein V502_00674 [Pseudogymnoascus sp. VKM F-4520 (FW-2644)]|nr:hypothetical protein V502_00674 [Pseudogymnoascus sp. VKM F-4520 (FW-2644)]
MASTQNKIRTNSQSSTGAIFTWQNNSGPTLIQDPPYDGRGVIDLTCELNSNFAMLQTNMKALQNRINWVDSETNTEPTCEEEWIKTEKAADEQEREIQWLRAENSRLGRELQNSTCANNGSTAGFDHDEYLGACNSSAATNASVTTVIPSGITYHAITPTSSAITNYSSGTNQTAINYPLGIKKWAGQGCTGLMIENKNLNFMSHTSNFTSYSSFRISRPLREREQLDFSRELVALMLMHFDAFASGLTS